MTMLRSAATGRAGGSIWVTDVDDDEWDAFVGAHPDGMLHQTSAWARAKGDEYGALRVALRGSDGQLSAGAQLLSRRVARVVGVGYVPYGPLASSSDEADRVLELLESEARRRGLSALLVQPTPDGLDVEAGLQRRGYRRSRIDVATSATFVVDTSAALDEIFARVSKSKRQGVRRSQRAGVTLRQGSAADLDTFHRLLTLSAERHGFLPMSRGYLGRLWAELDPVGHVCLLLAELDGETVAGEMLTVFNGVMDSKLAGWDLNDRTDKACVAYGLQWGSLAWAASNGVHTYDLGGMPRATALRLLADTEDRSIDHHGTRFKAGWGGELHIFPPTYERIVNRLGHLTYRLPSAVLSDNGLGGRLVNWVRGS